MKRFLTVVLAALLLNACSSSSMLTIEPPAALTDYKPELKVDALWARQLGKGVGRQYIKLAPLVEQYRVYAANRKGLVEAFDVHSGSRQWRMDLDMPINAGPGDGGDLLLLGGDAEVVALGKSDGEVRWRAAVSSEVLAAPVRRGGVVVTHTVDGVVMGLDASDGHTLWRYTQQVPLLSLRGVGAPQIEGGIVVTGFANGRLAALTVTEGKLIWEQALEVARGRTELERMVDVDGRLVVDQGVVYAAGYQGRIAALTLDTGRLLWTREFSSYTGIVAGERELYVTDAAGNVWALARSNGGTLWKQSALHGRELSAPALQGDAVVVSDFEGYLHWLSRDDGHLMARARVEDWETLFPLPPDSPPSGYKEDRAILAAPRVIGEYVYAMDKRGTLDAFRVKPVQP